MKKSMMSTQLRDRFNSLDRLLAAETPRARLQPVALKRDEGEDRVYGLTAI